EPAEVPLGIEMGDARRPLRSDAVRLQQIVLNLMSNAVKFTPAGGRVTVTASLDAAGAVIAVTDTGIGMKAEEIPIALEPFRQIDGSPYRPVARPRLGLHLAQAMLALPGR